MIKQTKSKKNKKSFDTTSPHSKNETEIENDNEFVRNIVYGVETHLDKLDEYKTFSNRYKAIPGELKVINDSIKAMSKEKKVCDRIITLKDLEYLQLIDEAHLEGESLVLTIKPLNIFPSEPLGKCFDKKSYENNKYFITHFLHHNL